MSRIKEMIESLQENEAYMKHVDDKKISVTLRLEEMTVWSLDFLAKSFEQKRTPFSISLMEEAVIDAMEAAGYPFEEQRCMFIAAKSGRKIDAVRADMAKTGFFSQEDK